MVDIVSVRKSPSHSRYEILEAETVVGSAHYLDLLDRDPAERIFYHTTVDENHEDE